MRTPHEENAGRGGGGAASLPVPLGRLKKGEKGRIEAIGTGAAIEDPTVRRLIQLGLMEGAEIVIVHEAPISRDPIAVRVRGSLIALRRREADAVLVRRTGETGEADDE